MSDLSDRIAKALLERYRILWADPDTALEVEEDPLSLSVTLEHILGPEPWRAVLGFQPGEHPTSMMVRSKTLTLKQQAGDNEAAVSRVMVAFDAAMKEILQEFGSAAS